MKYLIVSILALTVFACSQNNNADMYEASELSSMMREMVVWSKASKAILAKGDTIESVPQSFYDLAKQHATRDEHEETASRVCDRRHKVTSEALAASFQLTTFVPIAAFANLLLHAEIMLFGLIVDCSLLISYQRDVSTN